MARLRLLRPVGAAPDVPVLETERLTLRLPLLTDHREWARLRADSAEFLKPWEPLWTADELSRATFRSRIRSQTAQVAQGRSLPYFLFERRSDTLVGGLTVSNIRRGVAQAGTLGYWMGQAYAGQGYMREAVEAVCGSLHRSHGLHRIEAATIASNNRSIGLLEHCGFRCEGVARAYLKIADRWQDHLLYARVADDPLPAVLSVPRAADDTEGPVEAIA